MPPASASQLQRYSPQHLWSLPCALTFLRLPLALVFLAVANQSHWALLVLLAAALTDILDGWVARRLGQQTATGAALDGSVDKVFVLCVVLGLYFSHRMPWWQLLLLGVRDAGEGVLLLLVGLGDRRLLLHGKPHASVWSKATTVLQFTAIIAVLLGVPAVPFLVLAAVFGLFATASLVRELVLIRRFFQRM